MITFYTRTGDRYTCPRVDYSHWENGLTVACTACCVELPEVDGRWRATEDIAHRLDNVATSAERIGLSSLARDLRDDALQLHSLALTQWGEENRSSQMTARERTARAV